MDDAVSPLPGFFQLNYLELLDYSSPTFGSQVLRLKDRIFWPSPAKVWKNRN